MIMSANEIHNHIERLSNLLRTESRQILMEHGLQPVQLEVLHYLSACNRYSNTGKGVAEYLGQTKGTISQSIKVLERKGLITKQTDHDDKRIIHLIITSSARNLLKETIPASLFRNASKKIKKHAMGQITNSLNIILNDGNYLCGLTKEVLTLKEVQLICCEHDVCEQPPSV